MKLRILFYLLVFLPNAGYTQFSDEQLINICDFCEEYQNQYADLDGDGDLDIIIWILETSKLQWLENDGTGNFFKRHLIAENVSAFTNFKVVDINGDGTQDVLFLNRSEMETYLNNGQAIFTKKNATFRVNQLPKIIGFADLDGDNDLDPILYSWLSDIIFYLVNDGQGSFTEQIDIGVNSYSRLTVEAFNFSGNGAADVFVSSNNGLTHY